MFVYSNDPGIINVYILIKVKAYLGKFHGLEDLEASECGEEKQLPHMGMSPEVTSRKFTVLT